MVVTPLPHNQITTKKVVSQAKSSAKLTVAERAVLHLLTEEFLTPSQITARRHTSQQATSKIIKSLKQKGAFDTAFNNMVVTPTPLPLPHNQKVNQIRLHGEHWVIKLLTISEKFMKYKEGTTLNIDGNTIITHKNKIQVYSGQSFYADTAIAATAKGLEHWNRFFARLEQEFNVVIIKPRIPNRQRVNAHYSEINNETSTECEIKKEKIKIISDVDGKLWAEVDNSLNWHEFETKGQKSEGDMQNTVAPVFNDYREKRSPLPGEVWSIIAEQANHVKELGAGLNVIVKLITPSQPSSPQVPPLEKKKEEGSYFG
ncbi:MAG: helix-turn-helix domain-containing protein [Nanoarchaeota archaeon]|nr:helix-turn-helix domain-containing protein [Nanoarchaeota archaeon]